MFSIWGGGEGLNREEDLNKSGGFIREGIFMEGC